MRRLKTNQKGFTIIELLIATAIFSTVLLLCTYALIEVGRIYYKGIIESRTQETARSIMAEISESAQFIGGDYVPLANAVDGSKGFCMGDKRYSYLLQKQLADTITDVTDQSKHALVADDLDSCNSGVTAQALSTGVLTSTSRELLGENMRVVSLDVALASGNLGFYDVTISILYGDKDLITDTDIDTDSFPDNCGSGGSRLLGTQFCAASRLSTKVQKRIK